MQSIFIRYWKSYSEKCEQAFLEFTLVFMVVMVYGICFLGLSYLILINSS